jgi:hypothetical protein
MDHEEISIPMEEKIYEPAPTIVEAMWGDERRECEHVGVLIFIIPMILSLIIRYEFLINPILADINDMDNISYNSKIIMKIVLLMEQ